jgi:excisionase family DNA binding protein
VRCGSALSGGSTNEFSGLERGESDRGRRSVKADHGIQPVRLADRLALRPPEVAAALGVGERTVRRWMRDDALPFRRLDGVVLIPRRALEQWLEEQIQEERMADELAEQVLDGI